MSHSLPRFYNIGFKDGSLSGEEGLILLLCFLCKMNIADAFRNIPYDDHLFLSVCSDGDIMAQPSVKAMHE